MQIPLKIFSPLLLCFISLMAYSQKWEIGGSVGATGYMGDLNPDNPFQYNNIGISAAVKRNFDPTWGIRANVGFVPVSWTGNYNRAVPNEVNFSNKIRELSLLAEFNFFNYINGGIYKLYTPYLFAGIGALYHRPYTTQNEEKEAVNDLRYNVDADGEPLRFKEFALSLPFGSGFKYNFKGPMALGIELMYRLALTNQIDDIEGYYANPPDSILTLNGTGYKFDGFMSASISFTYSFISQNCLWW